MEIGRNEEIYREFLSPPIVSLRLTNDKSEQHAQDPDIVDSSIIRKSWREIRGEALVKVT